MTIHPRRGAGVDGSLFTVAATRYGRYVLVGRCPGRRQRNCASLNSLNVLQGWAWHTGWLLTVAVQIVHADRRHAAMYAAAIMREGPLSEPFASSGDTRCFGSNIQDVVWALGYASAMFAVGLAQPTRVTVCDAAVCSHSLVVWLGDECGFRRRVIVTICRAIYSCILPRTATYCCVV